jgi:hypothetical protein
VAAFALFVAVQIADGVWTATGVAQFGTIIEANPCLLALMNTVGVPCAILAAKVTAIAGGALLHARAQHLPLAILTVVYVFGALLPWAWLLAA